MQSENPAAKSRQKQRKVCKIKRNKKKIISLTAIIILLILLCFLIWYLKGVADYKQAVRETTIEEINLSDVADGTYTGEYDVNFIYAKVEVTVQDGAVTDIKLLEHKNGRGKAAEVIPDRMIAAQKIDVDAVSGATNSSTVIKKAVKCTAKRAVGTASTI